MVICRRYRDDSSEDSAYDSDEGEYNSVERLEACLDEMLNRVLFHNEDKYHGEMCIGTWNIYDANNDRLFVSIALKISGVYHIGLPAISRYFNNIPKDSYRNKRTFDILQIQRKQEETHCIVKTIWLKLIQRHWKNAMHKSIRGLLYKYSNQYKGFISMKI